MNKETKVKKSLTAVFVCLIIAVLVGLPIFLACKINYSLKHPTVYNFELAEMQDGIYAYIDEVVSSIPAQNYTMATFRVKGGSVYTVKGSVKSYENKPGNNYAYVVWEHNNVVNADSVTIYAPTRSVVYNGAVTIARR